MVDKECPCRAPGTSCQDAAVLSGGSRPRRLARREALAAGTAGLALLLLDRLPGGIAVALARSAGKKFRPPSGSRKVGNLKQLPPDRALAVTDPHSGRPAVVVRLSGKKKLYAYSAVCTHAGCTVGYDSGRKLLVCPCHHSTYDPAHGASVLSGPAPYPLPSLKVALDPKGNIWLA